jgi:hypothetical protein
MKNEVLNFLEKKNYLYSTSKLDIPDIVIDSISSINKEPFKIGDSTDVGKISFSDVRLLTQDGKDTFEYKRKLHFVLLNDTLCLIAYIEGGIGTHDVVDYFQYKGKYKHVRYSTTEVLSDTNKLSKYLQNNPKPD